MRKKNKKIKFKKIIIILLVIFLVGSMFFIYRNLKVKNIYVTGNKLLKESTIIELASLKDYPYLHSVQVRKIEDELRKNPLIEDVSISKTLLGKVMINITENKVFYQDMNGKYTLSNGDKVDLDISLLGIPTLINNPLDMEDKLVTKMALVTSDILKKISEIEYQPNDLDKERFMFYMSDGNYVYVTLNRLSLINTYNEIYPTLEGKKGILYLDSGNHFEIKKDNNKASD